MRKLVNPTESMDNVEKPERYRTHGTRVSSLLNSRSLAAVRKAMAK